MSSRDRFTGGVLLLGPAFGLVQPAFAANVQGSATESSGLEVVVVTAQKREEQAQQTPISMTVFSADMLAQRSITNLADIPAATPSLVITKSNNNQFGTSFAIRGVSAVGSGESPVGVYVDGVYVASQSSLGTNGIGLTGLLDASRIEVLKGPQGTLYGRNTAAGAVNIYSTLPTDRFEGRATVNVGNHGSQTYTGVLNAPIAADKLAARVAVEYGQSDGYQRNLAGGDDLGSYDKIAARGTLLFTPSEQLIMTLRADYGKADGAGNPLQLTGVRPTSSFISEVAAESGLPLDAAGLAAARALVAQYTNGPRPSLNAVTLSSRSKGEFEAYGGSLTVDFKFTDDVSLRSISAYRNQKSSAFVDYDVTPFVGVSADVPADIDQLTQELTLSGVAWGDTLKYAVGAFYYDLDKTEGSVAQAIPRINPASPNTTDLETKNSSYAGYAQATYTIVDGLNVTGGLRYTGEDKDLISRSHSALGCLVPVSEQIAGQCRGEYHTSFSNVSYTAGLDYDLSSDVLLYVKAASGFRAGGTNAGSSVAGSYRSFKPEDITTYETGVKSQFFDDRLRLNIDYYHSDYTNLQKTVVIVVPPSNILLQSISNAASATIDGVEFEGAVELAQRLLLSATAAYMQPKYDRFVDTTGDHGAQKFVDAPKWTYSISAAYTAPRSHLGDLRAQIDYSWRSDVDLAPNDETSPAALHSQDAYGLLNARVSLAVTEWNADIAIWEENLTDERYFTGNISQWNTIGYILSSVGDPRTFGLEITKRF